MVQNDGEIEKWLDPQVMNTVSVSHTISKHKGATIHIRRCPSGRHHFRFNRKRVWGHNQCQLFPHSPFHNDMIFAFFNIVKQFICSVMSREFENVRICHRDLYLLLEHESRDDAKREKWERKEKKRKEREQAKRKKEQEEWERMEKYRRENPHLVETREDYFAKLYSYIVLPIIERPPHLKRNDNENEHWPKNIGSALRSALFAEIQAQQSPVQKYVIDSKLTSCCIAEIILPSAKPVGLTTLMSGIRGDLGKIRRRRNQIKRLAKPTRLSISSCTHVFITPQSPIGDVVIDSTLTSCSIANKNIFIGVTSNHLIRENVMKLLSATNEEAEKQIMAGIVKKQS